MVPTSPTANTSLPELPQTPRRLLLAPWIIALQALPLKCRMVPPSPTANTSLPELPQTLKRGKEASCTVQIGATGEGGGLRILRESRLHADSSTRQKPASASAIRASDRNAIHLLRSERDISSRAGAAQRQDEGEPSGQPCNAGSPSLRSGRLEG